MTINLTRIVAHDLTVERGGHTVLSGLNFTCDGGSALIVRGMNGAGKSTLLRAIATLLEIRSGEIVLEGLDLEEPAQRAEYIHYLGHSDGLKSSLTVEENISLWQAYYGNPDDGLVREALEFFGLGAMRHLPTHYLSAGQRKRLALSRLVASSRPLWLLDEPLSSLDDTNRKQLIKAIDRHTAGGGIAILTTHEDMALERSQTLRLDPDFRDAA